MSTAPTMNTLLNDVFSHYLNFAQSKFPLHLVNGITLEWVQGGLAQEVVEMNANALVGIHITLYGHVELDWDRGVIADLERMGQERRLRVDGEGLASIAAIFGDLSRGYGTMIPPPTPENIERARRLLKREIQKHIACTISLYFMDEPDTRAKYLESLVSVSVQDQINSVATSFFRFLGVEEFVEGA